MSNITAIEVPDIGVFDTVEVIEILVKVGDAVKAEQSLITVESDKASMEIPTSIAGIVKAIAVKVGDKIKQGSVMLSIEASAAAPSARNCDHCGRKDARPDTPTTASFKVEQAEGRI